MRTKATCLVLLLIISALHSAPLNNCLTYTDPLPNASFVSPSATVILKFNNAYKWVSYTNSEKIRLEGSISGVHSYDIIYSDDRSVAILKPHAVFTNGETVTVKFTASLQAYSSVLDKEPFSYSFKIRSTEIHYDPADVIRGELAMNDKVSKTKDEMDGGSSLPQVTVDYSYNPDNGFIFVNNIAFGPLFPNTPYLLILKNNGTPYFARENPTNAFDMKVQPNGSITYYDAGHAKFMVLDSAYNLVDSVYCDNGYGTDVHELRILSSGHMLIMSYDPEIVDMSQIVPGGSPNATVTGLVVQELDANKNVVFQWRSWDHFQITDATHEDLTAGFIDYVHGNALDLDNDGNILLSSRHMDEITKINRQTGDIIWRFGGKNNQFTLTGDPDGGFSHQHAIRRIADGNLTLFDNGNYHTPPHSRACEYSVDEVNKTATLVWQYRNTPDIYGAAMGYAQRLENGNTVIGWGFTNPSVTEVRSDGTKVYQMTFATGVFSYRAYKFHWKESDGQLIVPSSFSMSQNFPNPFNPLTTINLEIPAQENDASVSTKLVIYDILGNKVADLINSDLRGGRYQVTWSAYGVSSGVYFFRLTAGSFVSTKKMMLVK